MRVLVLDNYDSFTYNLVQALAVHGAEVEVRLNDAVTAAWVKEFPWDALVISPGPKAPESAGITMEVATTAVNGEFGSRPVLGVCLGHQALGIAAGAELARSARVRHGKPSPILHGNAGIFAGLPSPFLAGRYHSLELRSGSLPGVFQPTAMAQDDSVLMGIAHTSLPVFGVQFHPESILTEHGPALLKNFLALA